MLWTSEVSTREPSLASATVAMVTAALPSPKEVTGTSRTAEVSWTDMTKRSPITGLPGSTGTVPVLANAMVAVAVPPWSPVAVTVTVYSVAGERPVTVA